jgi:hypothetical protein
MANALVVATTEATDPTRVRDPFRTSANVSETSSNEGLRGEARGVAEEVVQERSLKTSHQETVPAKPMEPIGSYQMEKEVKHDGCKEEGCKEASRQEEDRRQEEEVVTTTSFVF